MNKISKLVSFTALIIGFSGPLQLSDSSAVVINLGDSDTPLVGQNSYQLRAENSQDASAIFKLYYQNVKDDEQLPGTTELTLQGHNTFSIELYKGNRAGDSAEAELFDATNDLFKVFVLKVLKDGSSNPDWLGDIANRGNSLLHFISPTQNTGETAFKWYTRHAPAGHLGDTSYLFRRASSANAADTFKVTIYDFGSTGSDYVFGVKASNSLTIGSGTTLTINQEADVEFEDHATSPAELNYRITSIGGSNYPLLELADTQNQLTIPSLRIYFKDSFLDFFGSKGAANLANEAVLLTGKSDLNICFKNTRTNALDLCGEEYLIFFDSDKETPASAVLKVVVEGDKKKLVLTASDSSAGLPELSRHYSVSMLRTKDEISKIADHDNGLQFLEIQHLLSAHHPANLNLDNPSEFTTEVTLSGYLLWMRVNKKTVDHKLEFKAADDAQIAEVLVGCKDASCYYAPVSATAQREIDSTKLELGEVYFGDGSILSVGAGVSLVSSLELKLVGTSKIEIKLNKNKDESVHWREGSKILIKGNYPVPANLLEKIDISFEALGTLEAGASDYYYTGAPVTLIQYQRTTAVTNPPDLSASRGIVLEAPQSKDYDLYVVSDGINDKVVFHPRATKISDWLVTWEESATKQRFYFKHTITETFATELIAAGQEVIANLEADKTYLFSPLTPVSEALVKSSAIDLFTNDGLSTLINALSARDMLSGYEAILHHTERDYIDADQTISGFRVDGREEAEKERLLFKSEASLEVFNLFNSVGKVELKKASNIHLGQDGSTAAPGKDYLGKISWGVGLSETEQKVEANQPQLWIKNAKVSFEKTAANSNLLYTLNVAQNAELIFANLESPLIISGPVLGDHGITIENLNSLKVENEAKALIGKLLEGKFLEKDPSKPDIKSFIEPNQGEKFYQTASGSFYLTAEDDARKRSLYFIKDAFYNYYLSEIAGTPRQIIHFNQPLTFTRPDQALAVHTTILSAFDSFLLERISNIESTTSVRGDTSEFAILNPSHSSYKSHITTAYNFLADLKAKNLSALNAGSVFPTIFRLTTEEADYTIEGLSLEASHGLSADEITTLKAWFGNRNLIYFENITTKLNLTLGDLSAGNVYLNAKEIQLSLQKFSGILEAAADKLAVRQEFEAGADLNTSLLSLSPSVASIADAELTIVVAGGRYTWDGVWKGRRGALDDGKIDYNLIFTTSTDHSIITYGTAANAVEVRSGGSITINSGIDVTTDTELRFLPGAKLSFEVRSKEAYGQLFIVGEVEPTLAGNIEILFAGQQEDLNAIVAPLELIVLDKQLTFGAAVTLPTLISDTLDGARLAFNPERNRLQLLLENAIVTSKEEVFEPTSAQEEAVALKHELVVDALFNHLPALAENQINGGGQGQVDWLFVNKNNSNEKVGVSQGYSLEGGTYFKQVSIKAVLFFNHLSLYTTKKTTAKGVTTSTKVANSENLVGGLVKADYLTPIAGLSGGGYLGAAATLGENTLGFGLAGINLDYTLAFQKTVYMQVGGSTNLDFIPVLTKAGDDLKTELHFRGQVGGSFAVNSDNLIKMVKVGAILPLQLGINAKIKLDDTTTYSYSMSIKTGLTAVLEVHDMFKVQAGYKFHLSQKFISHGLVFSLDFSY